MPVVIQVSFDAGAGGDSGEFGRWRFSDAGGQMSSDSSRSWRWGISDVNGEVFCEVTDLSNPLFYFNSGGKWKRECGGRVSAMCQAVCCLCEVDVFGGILF